ncbi:MAG TPA: hypothetical protein VGO45_04120 [Bacteroidia bacterium]|jgi:hypothetical protein|nr:hypothetical protein [Bacteroidia bacterium]
MRKFIFLLFGLSSLLLKAQGNIQDSAMLVPLIHFSYAAQMPGGDLAKRFGYNSNLALNFSVKTDKNWIYGIDFAYIFGNRIRQNGVLDSISTKSGHFVIDVNGELADIRFYERGFSSTAWVGKIVPVFGSNPNSGILVDLGLGFMEYHLKIEDIGNRSPQLVGDLKKGYDRLTNGPSVSQFLGYSYLSGNRFINFFAGIECMEAFTKDRRAWDYQMMKPDDAQRIDLLYSVRVGWILPLYKRMPKAYYYY